MITTARVKELWKATGAGLLDCKKALQANDLGTRNATPAARQALEGLAHDLALHIVSARPTYLAPGDIPDDVAQQERDRIMAQLVTRLEVEA